MRWRPVFFAWMLFALNLAGILVTLFIVNFVETPSDLFNVITFTSFVVACALLGALVAARRPTNPIGWILSVVASSGSWQQ